MKNKKLNRLFAGGILSVAAAVFLSAAVPAFGAGDTQSGSSTVVSISAESETPEETPADTPLPEQNTAVPQTAAAPSPSAAVSASPTAAPESPTETPAATAAPESPTETPAATETPAPMDPVQPMDFTPGWNLVNGKYYYYLDDGTMVRGQWFKDGNDWYYFNDDGTMKSAEWFRDGIDTYYLRDWGGMLHDQFYRYEGKLYYFRGWGGMMYNIKFQANGKWYKANADGTLVTGWSEENGKYYYYNEDGSLYTQEGWLNLNGTYYYLNADGSRVQGQWLKDGNDWYYMNEDGTMKSAEWFQDGVDWYYLRDWGGMLHDQFYTYEGNRYYFRGWGGMMYDMKFQVGNKWYKANSDGTLVKGWTQEGDKFYYYDDQYTLYRQKGWLKLGNVYYYINADGSRVQGQWLKDGIDLYYMNADGTMKSAEWYKEGNDWYYFRDWGAALYDTLFYEGENIYYFESDCKMARGWYELDGYTYYFRDWGGAMNIPCVIDGVRYVFDSNGHLVEKDLDAEVGVKTVKNFLKNALLPVGNTLYVWAGGHDDADATRYGVNPQWEKFFNSQDENYNYTQHRYEYGNGLDCSGYVGWAVHQVMEDWATTTSTIMPRYYYQKGWGSYRENDTSMKFQTGDVVSMSGHVWIVIGQCSDGSAVIMHATPPYVQISGTVSSSGSTNSEAIQLAKQYMSKYYPVGYERYGDRIASKSYMTGVNHFTWSSSVLADPDGYRNMTPAQILADLFGE